MTSKLQLPLPIALLLENCRTSGKSDDEIIACIRKRDFSSLLEYVADPMMDFEERSKLADEMVIDWNEVIQNGYEFGFLHLNGLKKLLRFRFNLNADQDYVQAGMSLQHLKLNEQELSAIRALIHRQWSLEEEGVSSGFEKRLITIKCKSDTIS